MYIPSYYKYTCDPSPAYLTQIQLIYPPFPGSVTGCSCLELDKEKKTQPDRARKWCSSTFPWGKVGKQIFGYFISKALQQILYMREIVGGFGGELPFQQYFM
jgi:hypothetical protein